MQTEALKVLRTTRRSNTGWDFTGEDRITDLIALTLPEWSPCSKERSHCLHSWLCSSMHTLRHTFSHTHTHTHMHTHAHTPHLVTHRAHLWAETNDFCSCQNRSIAKHMWHSLVCAREDNIHRAHHPRYGVLLTLQSTTTVVNSFRCYNQHVEVIV